MKTPGNEHVGHQDTSLVIRFPGPRNVLSTSWLNGGYREDLQAVFNHQIPLAACEACHSGGSVKTYLEGVAESLSLNPDKTCGLVTRAEMKNTAVVTETFRDLAVTAMVTAGIDKNGGRAGDPASYYENGDSFEPVGGTINTILIIGADLPEYTLARALMTATEAKTVALQQLMARSIYSSGIATGSGTDMIAIIADPASPLHLSDAGKHAKLGELIGRVVIAATTQALELETNLSPASQRDVLVRLARFGITDEDIWNCAIQEGLVNRAGPDWRERFMHYLKQWTREPRAVAQAAAALHLVDEVEWGLLPQDVARDEIVRILQNGETDLPATGDRIPEGIITLLAHQAARGFLSSQEVHHPLPGPEKTGTE